MKTQKITLAIDDSSRSPILGSYCLALVGVSRSDRRKFSTLKVKDSKKLNANQIAHIVKFTNNGLTHLDGIMFTPSQIDAAIWDPDTNLNGLVARGIVMLLNRVPEFWKHKIIIDNCERDREKFEWRLRQTIEKHASGLLTIDLKTDEWIVEHHADDKYWECSLASVHAKHWSNLEMERIKATYGDCGSGNPGDELTLEFIKNNPKNPHVRKSWTTYQQLVEKGEIPPLDPVDDESEFEE